MKASTEHKNAGNISSDSEDAVPGIFSFSPKYLQE